ncbi:hypothetical protein AMTRI_Chr01g105160 [Amborella trichopoda]|uniref:Uncharacterized protein n=1 Tax=Amborella trichopoda TaxID=13333 RepID=U5D4A6_AMBTC|nr:centrosome and spindle pole-associated protein 1 [Amborella trichopoda]XP_011627206.1 centrosome and spindle pole-associated protein 1 [Amborella trichopoda]ERN16257.1 hypothetical protein AMTR_s00063p00144940 [Amborella trichopoda]|eukprot:XP_006854790.1 centrosome and spindle pole-associated protein 1 [Amborella trichopoda]
MAAYLQRRFNNPCKLKPLFSIYALRFKSNRASEHEHLEPSPFLASWSSPKDPRVAEKKLTQLRRDYAKSMREVRREYRFEVEAQMEEKRRKDEAKREVLRLAKEDRKAEKARLSQERAAERQKFEQEFRETLMKERAEKQANWRAKEERREEKKREKKELLRRQSSLWIDENDLEKRVLEAIVDTIPL